MEPKAQNAPEDMLVSTEQEEINEFETAFNEDSGQVAGDDPATNAVAPDVAPSDATPEPLNADPEPTPSAEQPVHSAQAENEERERQQELYNLKANAGRYAAEKRRREEVEAELKALRAKQAEANIKFSPDDIETEEIEAFRKLNPEIAKSTIEGPKGKLWQKLLVEHGADALIAQFELVQDNTEKARAEVRHELEVFKADVHLKAIEKEHPDWKQVLGNPNVRPEHTGAQRFHPDFVGWVRKLPYDVAQDVRRIITSGTAEEVNHVLTAYKKLGPMAQKSAAPAAPVATPQIPSAVPRAAVPAAKVNAALAVPSRGAPPPKPGPDKNDFAGAWREATAQRR
jgi:hypothetical protein